METPTTASPPDEAKPKKRNLVRHTRAIQRDRTQRPLGAPLAEVVVARLTEIVHPALGPGQLFYRLGLRSSPLTLPVRVGLMLSLLLWQIGGISERVRVIHVEAVLWAPLLRDLTQQALAQCPRTEIGLLKNL